MSDEAIVRLVITDSAAGARYSDTSSSAAGMSSSAAGMSGTALYSAITRAVIDLNKGFRESLQPTNKLLTEIRDTLERDYDYSERDYKESTAQTSLLKFIGAALSGHQGAVGREITKGIGLQSSDTQMVASLKDVRDSVRELKLSLSPEARRKNNTLLGDIIKGSILTLGLTKALPYLDKLIGKPGDIFDKLFKVEEVVDRAPEVTAASAEQVASPESVSMMSQVADAVINTISSHPAEVAALAIGAALGGVLYFLTPSKEKEKSVNELLAEMIVETGNVGTKIDRLTSEVVDSARYTQSVVLNTGVIDSRVEQIVDLMMQGIPTASVAGSSSPLSDETAAPGYENQGYENQGLGTSDMWSDLADEVENSINSTPDEYVPDTAYPEAEPIVPNTALPPTSLHDPWANWEMPHHGRGWNTITPEKLQDMSDVGMSPAQNFISTGEYEEMVQRRKDAHLPPPGFARGGAVGSDTIPAMLSPGEVVVPKHMVDGGAVDHLRGRLPGFAAGGLVEGAGRFLINQMDTDPTSRIARFGQGISAVGQTLAAAHPIIGGFIAGIGKGTEAIAGLMSAINETAQKYGEYSPEIAQAQAIADVQQTLGDMRRANESGPEMARFILAQSEMQQKLEDIKMEMLAQLLPAINNILEALNKVMGSGEGISAVITILTSQITVIGEAAKKLANLMEDDKVREVEDPTDILLKSNLFDTSAEGLGAGSSVPVR